MKTNQAGKWGNDGFEQLERDWQTYGRGGFGGRGRGARECFALVEVV